MAYDIYPSACRGLGVLVVPGFWRTRGYVGIRDIAVRLARDFGPTAVMDLPGHGESGGVFEFNRGEHVVVDTVTRRFVEETGVERVLLLGFSAGGAVCVSTAARHPDLPLAGLLLVSPVADFARVIPRPNPFTIHRHLSLTQAVKMPRFRWPGSGRLSAREDMRGVAVPTCFIHAKNDWLVSHHHSEALMRGARDGELNLLDVSGRYHADRIFDVFPGLVWPLVESFLRKVTEGAGSRSGNRAEVPAKQSERPPAM